MPVIEPLVELSFLSELRGPIERAGVRFDALLAEAGISPTLLTDGSASISLNVLATFYEITAAHTRNPAFGLESASQVTPGAGGLLGHIMLSAGSVREMLVAAVNYAHVHIRPIEATFTENGGVGCLAWRYAPSFNVPRTQYVAFMVAILVDRIRRAAGAGWMPLAVEFDHREPANLTDYQRVLGPRLRFDQRRFAVWVDPTALAASLPPLLPGLFETVKQLGDVRLAQTAADTSVVDQVSNLIRRRLDAHEPVSLDTTAAALGLGDRALQYRLQQFDTSFERLLGEVRRAEAERYLRDTDLSMSEIAERLGFAEPSVFTRAAQKWFEMSPRVYRRRLRGEPTSELDGGD